MPDLGSVRLSSAGTNIGTVRITSPVRTVVADPKFQPKPNVSMAEIVDVNLDNNRDGYTLVYNAETEEFEASGIGQIAVGNINGGSF